MILLGVIPRCKATRELLFVFEHGGNKSFSALRMTTIKRGWVTAPETKTQRSGDPRECCVSILFR